MRPLAKPINCAGRVVSSVAAHKDLYCQLYSVQDLYSVYVVVVNNLNNIQIGRQLWILKGFEGEIMPGKPRGEFSGSSLKMFLQVVLGTGNPQWGPSRFLPV